MENSIVFLGEKDHGKSTLIGRLLLDSKSIKPDKLRSVKQLAQKEKRPFELAHLIDSFQQERQRQMTMDSASAIIKRKNKYYHLIDVPGHQELISQMMSGTAQGKKAVLLIDVQSGIQKQTQRHLEIAQILGIQHLAIAVTKIDNIGYQSKVFNQLKNRIKQVLINLGYESKRIYFFPISALQGDNVYCKSCRTPWYKGPPLIKFIEAQKENPQISKNKPLRVLAQDSFNQKLLVKIESGTLRQGQKIKFLPSKKKVVIQEILVSQKKFREIHAIQNAGLVFKEKIKIPRGNVGFDKKAPLTTNKISGQAFWLQKPRQKNLVCECGLLTTKAVLLSLKNIQPHEKSSYQVRTKKPLVYDPGSQGLLNRLIFKQAGTIIGVGAIQK